MDENRTSDPTADYYKRCDELKAQARKRWEEAKEAGADVMEVRRLWNAMVDAGNTGD